MLLASGWSVSCIAAAQHTPAVTSQLPPFASRQGRPLCSGPFALGASGTISRSGLVSRSVAGPHGCARFLWETKTAMSFGNIVRPLRAKFERRHHLCMNIVWPASPSKAGVGLKPADLATKSQTRRARKIGYADQFAPRQMLSNDLSSGIAKRRKRKRCNVTANFFNQIGQGAIADLQLHCTR